MPIRPRRFVRRWPVLVCTGALLAVAVGCGSESHARSEGSRQGARTAPFDVRAGATPASGATSARRPVGRGAGAGGTRCVVGVQALASPTVAYGAIVRQRATTVYSQPGGSVVGRFGATDANGYRTVFGIVGEHVGKGCRPDWYRVQLSVTPNGSTGWVRAGAVSAFAVDSRIVIDLSARTLRLYRAGRLVLATQVGVGAPRTPTPVGRFFVNERFVLTTADGPFGPAALGLSAHSDVLHDWAQDGPIAVHGTNEPWTIGESASHGCIRVENAVMRRLFSSTPAGTPVVIRA